MAINLSDYYSPFFSTLSSIPNSNNINNSGDITTTENLNSPSIGNFSSTLQDYLNANEGNEENLEGTTNELFNTADEGDFSLYGDFFNSYSPSLNTDITGDTTTTLDSFTNNFQIGFQIQQINTLSSAIANLQSNLDAFEESADIVNSEIAQQHVESLTNNIALLDHYLTSTVTELTTEQSLLSSMNASSALTQFLLTRESNMDSE